MFFVSADLLVLQKLTRGPQNFLQRNMGPTDCWNKQNTSWVGPCRVLFSVPILFHKPKKMYQSDSKRVAEWFHISNSLPTLVNLPRWSLMLRGQSWGPLCHGQRIGFDSQWEKWSRMISWLHQLGTKPRMQWVSHVGTVKKSGLYNYRC